MDLRKKIIYHILSWMQQFYVMMWRWISTQYFIASSIWTRDILSGVLSDPVTCIKLYLVFVILHSHRLSERFQFSDTKLLISKESMKRTLRVLWKDMLRLINSKAVKCQLLAQREFDAVVYNKHLVSPTFYMNDKS